ncbi:MAG: DUF2071 domain-containing protein [Terrimicrobiaceae bacterium]
MLPGESEQVGQLSTQTAPHRPGGRPALRMRWEKLLFLHWAWEAKDLQARLPKGLEVEEFEGHAWLGVVPFVMKGVHPIGLFQIPWLSNFEELNVRTYVRSQDGQSGVWFFSLACNQPLAVEIARRGFHLNYVHAKISARGDSRMRYECQREGMSPGVFEYPTSPNKPAPASPGTLEHFLVERYVLFSTDRSGRLYAGHVAHTPYHIESIKIPQWSFQTAVADGFRDPHTPPDHAMIARDVEVLAWPIKKVAP